MSNNTYAMSFERRMMFQLSMERTTKHGKHVKK